jgi:hypothetical protein
MSVMDEEQARVHLLQGDFSGEETHSAGQFLAFCSRGLEEGYVYRFSRANSLANASELTRR